MPTGIIAVITVAVILAGALVNAEMKVIRRLLHQRFGPKYERLAAESDNKLTIDSWLAGRKRRAYGLDRAGTQDAGAASDPATDQAAAAAFPPVGSTT